MKQLSERTIQILTGIEWSGNVRELRNMIERLVILSPGKAIDEGLLASARIGTGTIDDIVANTATFQEFKDKAEAAYIKHMLERNNWNVSKTAEAIDIERSHLYSKLKKYGLERE
jgi:DNA-binding NtrC family response regulator